MEKGRRIPRSRDDVEQELIDQLTLIRRACAEFDKGFEPIGKHIALSLRVLLHQHGQSRSLLDQLGLRSGRFLDTAGAIDPKNLLSQHNLVAVQLGPAGADYIPLVTSGGFPGGERMIDFVDWWNEPVLKDGKGRTFSRRDIVSAVANTDGGAHVDPELDEAYMELSRKNSLGWVVNSGTGESSLAGRPELACVRQIAHELLHTLQVKGTKFSVHAEPVMPDAARRKGAFVHRPSFTIKADGS